MFSAFLGVQHVGSTFTRGRNLMPERWVHVTFCTDNCCFKNFCIKSLIVIIIHTCTGTFVHIERSLFTVTSVKPSLG